LPEWTSSHPQVTMQQDGWCVYGGTCFHWISVADITTVFSYVLTIHMHLPA
jgi:hypothetical protein